MRIVLRNIAAVVVGFVAASIVMMIVEYINGRFFYPDLAKAAADLKDRELIRALLATAPSGSFFAVIFGWALGSLIGGWVTTKVSRSPSTRPALILGVLLTLAGVANNLMIPPPVWFWIVGLVVFLPMAYLGARLADRQI